MRTPQVAVQGKVTVTRVDAPPWLTLTIEPQPDGGRDVRVNRLRVTERQARQMERDLNHPPGQDNRP